MHPVTLKAALAFALAANVVLAAPALAANDDPLVLMHGFGGWGREELFGYRYWGGTLDLQEVLQAQGHRTVTVAMGPISSNWDRAVEAYTQLAGGCVDYGAAHARQHGHAQFGRCHAPLLARWDAEHRVHLVSHSQGAPTANMLIELLRNGSAAERAASGATTSALFLGGKDWVRSHTAVAGAINGTTFGARSGLNEFARRMLQAIAAFKGAGHSADLPFDFKLDQWGLQRQPGERPSAYWDRVGAASIWGSKDVALYSLSTAGAALENQWVRTSPEVVYFSISATTTEREPLFGNQVPTLGTNLLLAPSAFEMGANRALGEAWLPNDGVVNTVSMRAPFGAPVVDFAGVALQGRWHHLGTLKLDHWQVVGSGDFIGNLGANERLRSLYLKQAQLLKSL